jgi:hypothetical protein
MRQVTIALWICQDDHYGALSNSSISVSRVLQITLSSR